MGRLPPFGPPDTPDGGVLVDLARSAGVEEAPIPVDLAEVAAGAVDRARARTPYADFALVTRPAALVGRPPCNGRW